MGLGVEPAGGIDDQRVNARRGRLLDSVKDDPGGVAAFLSGDDRRTNPLPPDRQLLDRYQRWRSLDTLMVAMSTDGLSRLYSVPGKTASAVRRFGMGLVDRIGPLKERLMAEARGTSGDLPLLLRGLPI